jgi:hypothetical protein
MKTFSYLLLLVLISIPDVPATEGFSIKSGERISAKSKFYQNALKYLLNTAYITRVISECEEYTDLTTKEVFVAGLSLGGGSIQRVQSQKCDSSSGLIVGGIKAKPGEFPHMAAIGYDGIDNSDPGKIKFVRGGSLISEKHVLTAAHCKQRLVQLLFQLI